MLKKILHGGFASLFLIATGVCISLLRSKIVIQHLPADEAGFWFLMWNMISILGFCDCGLSPALSREIGFAYKKSNICLRVSNLFFTIRRLFLFISCLAVLFLAIFWYLYFNHLSLNTDAMKQTAVCFLLVAFGIIIQLQTNPYLAIIYGRGEVSTERYLRALGPIIGIIISFWLVIKIHLGLYGLIIGYLAQSFSTYGFTRYIFTISIKLSKKGKYLYIIFKRIFEPSVQWIIISIGVVLLFQISNFVIGYILGVTQVPYFAIPNQIVFTIMSIAGVVGYIIYPFVSQAKGKNDMEKIRYFVSVATRGSMVTALLLGIFIFSNIKIITTIWLGSAFTVNKNVLLFLTIMAILEVNHVACATIAQAAGYMKFAGVSIIAGIMNLIISFVLIYRYGVVGAALSIMISQILTSNWYVVMVSLRYLKISFKQHLINTLLPVMFCAICFYFINAAVNKIIIFTNLYAKLFISFAIFFILCFFTAYLILLKHDEKDFLKSKLMKFIKYQIN